MVKLISPFIKKAALLVLAPLSFSPALVAAPIDLVVPESEHVRLNDAELVNRLCKSIKIEAAPFEGNVPFDTDLCIEGHMRHNLSITLQQEMRFEHDGTTYDVQIVSAKMPFVRSEQIEWFVRINGEFLWFAQSRRNLQRSEQFTIKQLAHNPDQNLLSLDFESKIYFPPSPDKKYDYVVNRYIIDLNTEKPMFWLYAMPVHQWQKWVHKGIKKEVSSLLLHPVTGQLILSGDQIYGQQSRWLESVLPELPSKVMNNIHPANMMTDDKVKPKGMPKKAPKHP